MPSDPSNLSPASSAAVNPASNEVHPLTPVPAAPAEGAEPPVLVLIGPTASGKAALAVQVAHELASRGRTAEVINADSMLVYRGMDIGTAKPTTAERGGVPHRLIGIAEITETASVADFQVLARAAIADCRSRAVVPIVVGGSSLYVRAIIDKFDFPGTDPLVRAHWEDELASRGPQGLHQILAEREPEAAAEIQPGNGRRIVRALEVIELTGSFTAHLPTWEYDLPAVVQVGLDLPREVLDERIAERVEQMWAEGFVDEVRRLLDGGLRSGVTASRALGYRQVISFLDGDITEDQAKEQTLTRTRRFARKQLGWYRRDDRIVWMPAQADDLASQVTDLLTAAGDRR